MMLPNQRPPFPGPMPVRPFRPGVPAQAPGSEMTRPVQRSVLQPQQTFARPFSQIGSPGMRTSYPTF